MARGRKDSRAVAVRFGKNLYRCRKASGPSQEELAFLAALHRTEIGLLERGERVPRVDTLVRLAVALGVPPGRLLEGIGWELPSTSTGEMTVDPQDD